MVVQTVDIMDQLGNYFQLLFEPIVMKFNFAEFDTGCSFAEFSA
jgi:hypothetical protein